jgi:hypothetical protein
MGWDDERVIVDGSQSTIFQSEAQTRRDWALYNNPHRAGDPWVQLLASKEVCIWIRINENEDYHEVVVYVRRRDPAAP